VAFWSRFGFRGGVKSTTEIVGQAPREERVGNAKPLRLVGQLVNSLTELSVLAVEAFGFVTWQLLIADRTTCYFSTASKPSAHLLTS
jgi:hypothetical protein